MSELPEAWAMYDARTGKRVGMASVGWTEARARAEVSRIRGIVEEGRKRQDLRDLIPHLEVVRLTEDTWGSRPGDVIAPPQTTQSFASAPPPPVE